MAVGCLTRSLSLSVCSTHDDEVYKNPSNNKTKIERERQKYKEIKENIT